MNSNLIIYLETLLCHPSKEQIVEGGPQINAAIIALDIWEVFHTVVHAGHLLKHTFFGMPYRRVPGNNAIFYDTYLP